MRKTMQKKSDDLMDIHEVAAYYGLSESSIRRRVRAARNGQSNFILPLFSSGSRVLFRKVDVLSWAGEDAECTTFTLPSVPAIPQAAIKSQAQTRRELIKLGIDLPPLDGNESNN
jgi:hypothetical protein